MRKAGVSELDGLERKDDQGKVDPDVKDTDSQVVPNKTWPDKANQATAKDSSAKNATASSTQASVTATSSAKSRSKGPRKSVTFAEDTKEEPLISSNRSVLGLPELPAKKANPTPIVNSQIKDISDSKDSPSAIVPENESPEDAKLRKEMLQYGLSEVGAVVAELALEESGSETSYSDIEFEEEDGEEEYSSSVEDEEDKFGRSTRREVTDDYRREMRELEMRLNARAMENVGPKMGPSDDGTDDVAQDVKQIVVDIGGTGDQSNAKSDGSVKKAVRFAPELDISPAPERRMEDMSQFKDSKSALPPLNEAVIERQNQITKPPSTSSPTQRKVSRFKSSLSKVHTPTEDNQVPATTPPEANKPSINQSLPELIPTHNKSSPLHPSASAINHHLDSKPDNPMLPNIPQTHHTPSTPLSAQIIERPTPMTQTPPTEPDDLDPKLLNQQVATEYHRMRNRFIQREGGFRVREDEEGIVPLTEEAGRKISRFKAAKLGRGES